MLIASFGDGAGSKLKTVKQLSFEVTVDRVVSQTLAKLSSCRTEPTLAGQFAASRSITKTNPRNAVERPGS